MAAQKAMKQDLAAGVFPLSFFISTAHFNENKTGC
jgi:hypothetical protein